MKKIEFSPTEALKSISNEEVGRALANPNSAAASVTLTLLDSNSTLVATTSVSIPASGHLSEYVGEMFPSLMLGNFQGKLSIASTQPLIGLTLLQQQSLFTSLPIIP